MQRLTVLFLSGIISLILSGHLSTAKAQEKNESEQKIQTASWVKVTPQGAGFSVLMPGAPKETIDTVIYGSFKVPTSIYTVTTGKAGFYVGRIGDFPEQLVTAGYIDGLYDNIHRVFFEGKDKDGKTDTMPFTRRDISLDGFGGREYVAGCGPYKEADAPCNNTIRVYKVGDSLFIIGVGGPKSILSTELTDKFFKSLVLTK